MFTRRHLLTTMAIAPAVALADSSQQTLQFINDEADALPSNSHPDRYLTLTLSSDLRHQAWTYGNQNYVEVKDQLTLNEDELVRVTLVNDTALVQPVIIKGLQFRTPPELNSPSAKHSAKNRSVIMQPNTSIAVDIMATLIGDAYIVARRSNCPRLIAVRPCNQGHPPVVV